MIDTPLRALWVTNMFPNRETGEFLGYFVGQQHQALVATGEITIDVEIVGQGRGTADYLLANPRVRRRFLDGAYDLVHVHYGITGAATISLPRVPMIFTLYGSDINQRIPYLVTRLVAARARRRIFVSRRLAEKWSSDRNVILPNGVDFETCLPRPRDEACHSPGLDPARKWILFGSFPFKEVKGYDVFTEVVSRVKRQAPEVGTIILSEEKQPYSRVVDKLNAADVLLFTSRQGKEGSPTVVKESLATGLPVVTVDVGDVREMLDGVTPGSIVDWPDKDRSRESWLDDLAREVLCVLESGQRADGRDRRRSLDQSQITRRILGLYREVVAGAGRS